MAYNKSTTIGEVDCLAEKALDENDIFRIGKKGVAKAFLQKLLELSRETGYADVEAAYRQSSSIEDIPENSEEFWIFIEKNYLFIEMEPKEMFVELTFQVTEDLGKIAENLKYISKERKILEDKKTKDGRLSADDRYYRNQLDYFENKNIVARAEIVDFMATGIKSYAIRKAATKSPIALSLGLFFKESPYAFGRTIVWSSYDPYDVRSLDKYSNKFHDLPVPNYRELIKECRKSPESFKEIAHSYIAGIPDSLPTVREKLEKLVGESHILACRKEVISTMLRHFEKKDYISFVSIAPLQIEGIFADVCREIGVSENQLDISSLNDKLQHIDGKINSFFYFEYYSFKFPVLRNLVAHGGLVDGDLEDMAVHLMLDLLPVCELAVSKELPINHALDVLNEASKSKYEKLVEWLYLREDVKIPDFYGVKEKIVATDALYTSTGFWKYLEKELKSLNSVDKIKNSTPHKIAGMVKKSHLAPDEAEKFLKSAYHIASKAIKERDQTVERVRRNLGLPKQD